MTSITLPSAKNGAAGDPVLQFNWETVSAGSGSASGSGGGEPPLKPPTNPVWWKSGLQSSAGARQVAGTTGANTVWLSPCKYDCTAEKLMARPLLFFSAPRTVAVVVPLGSVQLESMASVVMSQSTYCSISAVGSA